MKKGGIPRGAWALLVLLAIATGMILFGSREFYTNPDSSSYAASGVRAYRSLLEKNGFKTRQSLSTLRSIRNDELAVCIFLANGVPNFNQDKWHEATPLGAALKRHLETGGRALIVSVPSNFRDSSKEALKAPIEIKSAISTETRKISSGQTLTEGDWTDFAYSEKDYVLWRYSPEETAFLWIDKFESGYLAGIANGLGMTNRFIHRDDNARVMLEATFAAAGPHRKVVFLEAAHGMVSNPSLVELIGPWAAGAWWQLTVAFVVLVAALGVRFGLPERERFRQRGSREIVDAMSDLFARSKATEVAMEALLEDADRQIRKRLKIAGDTPKDVRDRELPDELAKLMYHAENAVKERAPLSVALPLARRLDAELNKFIGVHERKPARRKRR